MQFFVGQIAKIAGGLVKDRKVKKLGWGWDVGARTMAWCMRTALGPGAVWPGGGDTASSHWPPCGSEREAYLGGSDCHRGRIVECVCVW